MAKARGKGKGKGKSEQTTFDGFPRQCVTFWRQLKKNNDKVWFDAHRDDYEQHVKAPAQAFVAAMGERLIAISRTVEFEPRVNKSLFRINRDIRFSKDKTPYKTHMGILFWDGGKRMACPGFYFQLDPARVLLAAGMHMFDKPMLQTYRDAVVHPKHGPALVRAIKKVEAAGHSVMGKHYKRIPKGYDPEHKNAELLLHNGMGAMTEHPIPDELYSAELIDWCFTRYKAMAPLHTWLLGVL